MRYIKVWVHPIKEKEKEVCVLHYDCVKTSEEVICHIELGCLSKGGNLPIHRR